MEGERDERQEAAGLVLLVAQAQQVVDALLVGLDVAVEHRAVRRHPQPVRGVVRANQWSGCSLPGATSLRTRSAKTSAPPPGSEPSPAAFSSRSTSSCVRPESVVMWWISEAV